MRGWNENSIYSRGKTKFHKNCTGLERDKNEKFKEIVIHTGQHYDEIESLVFPCTAWVETVEDGWNVLVGADKEKIIEMVNSFEPEGGVMQVIKLLNFWDIFTIESRFGRGYTDHQISNTG